MFDVGFAELFLLALIGLLVLGPERLPGVARTLGGFVRKARTSWISLRNTIEAELTEADLSSPIKKASEEIRQIGKELTDMPSFKPENQEIENKHAESKTADTPESITRVAPEPATENTPQQKPTEQADSGKSENA